MTATPVFDLLRAGPSTNYGVEARLRRHFPKLKFRVEFDTKDNPVFWLTVYVKVRWWHYLWPGRTVVRLNIMSILEPIRPRSGLPYKVLFE